MEFGYWSGGGRLAYFDLVGLRLLLLLPLLLIQLVILLLIIIDCNSNRI